MKRVCFYSIKVRVLLSILAIIFASVNVFGAGWTPTDCGLVVNFQPGERFLLSTMMDKDGDGTPEEYFVCHYSGYTGGAFKYTAGNYLKLIPQASGVTEPSPVSVWTVDTALTRVKDGVDYRLGGISYTMWSSTQYTLCTTGNDYSFVGNLDNNIHSGRLCDVVFAVPTVRSTSADPNNTLGRADKAGDPFDGRTGIGFAGMVYREVFMLDLPRQVNPTAYVNFALVSFKSSDGKVEIIWNDGANDNKKQRTLFRLYALDNPFNNCPNSYYFGFDEQDYVKYREGPGNKPRKQMTDSTSARKIYTMDRMRCMERIGDSKSYQTDFMYVPVPDSTYYYVGYANHYRHNDLGANGASSQFKKIRELPLEYMRTLKAPAGACGRMVVEDTTSTADNLNVVFRPAGVFLRTNTGQNVRMLPNADGTVWTSEEMWHITDAYSKLEIKATLFSGPEYSDADPGMDIPGWSEMVKGTEVPVVGGGSVVDNYGWARIYTNNTAKNGAIEFVPANPNRHIHYDNNGFLGSQVPDQYPEHGSNSVTIEEDRLVGGFDFECWTTNPDGTGIKYYPGDVVNLEAGELTLYAKAVYTGTIHVALSFMHSDGKRYFLTHPGAEAPRFSHARRIDEWTDAWQGMENAENKDPRYINTFKLKNDFGVEGAGEFALDPRREMRRGAKDSLLFYEYFAPDKEEYLGLYYTDPNTVIANNTWAGLFTSTQGWPDYSVADVQNTKLKSTHYVHRAGDVLTRDERSNSSAPFVKYNAAANQFDGTADEAEATTFQISRVRVADEHYVVIPDTTEEWINEITFGYHAGERAEQQVWSKLIGKQLMAVTKIGNDTVYFHPNHDKILTTAGELRLSPDYRLTESFAYIRDSRAEGLVISEDDKPHMTETSNEFSRLVSSGMNSPMDVEYQGNYIDIVDTLRITLSPRTLTRIKDYYGRWKKGAEGLHLHADGSRHRDIIVRTKTYHYGPVETKLVLTPEFESYAFSPLGGAENRLNFKLLKVTSRWLLDAENNQVREDISSTEDVTTTSLALRPGFCTFKKDGSSDFQVVIDKTVNDHVTIVTKADNNSGINYDTLVISGNATIDAVNYPINAEVALLQPTLEGHELVCSTVYGGERYFIMANRDGLIFRQYSQRLSGGVNMLFKKDTWTHLRKGSYDADNSDPRYITPWKFEYVDQAAQQLTLSVGSGINRNFVISDETTPGVGTAEATVLTYEYDTIYVNDNANFEEIVRLRYGEDKWLKFELLEGSTPSLTLTDKKAEASAFSLGYLLQEYSLLNNGNYPDKAYAEFGYNSTNPVTIQTRYKAYREYSMLLGNVQTYCGREEEADLTKLTAAGGDWKTSYSVSLVSDNRFAANASELGKSTDTGTLKTTVTPSDDSSPTEIRYPATTGPFVNIVDTLDVQISLQPNAPAYRFKDKWSGFSSIEDAHLKIPIIRRTYHSAPYDSLVCLVDNDEYSHIFPSTVVVGVNDTYEFVLHTEHRTGAHVLSVENESVSATGTAENYTSRMNFRNPALAEIRLIDEYGNTPEWCEISGVTANTITVKCTQNGIRAPREAFIYLAYTMQDDKDKWRYINYRLSVSQPSLFQYANNQTLVHTKGASGDPLLNGMQQVHENKRILYYYNPSNAEQSADQNVELPIRERGYYGWWRWYQEGEGEIGDTDIPAETWRNPPTNTGKFNYPFRIIGDSVWVQESDHSQGKKLVTMGRYTVFHNPSDVYDRNDPPAKAPQVYPPTDKKVVTYVADLSNYYDNLPLSMTYVNQIDTAKLDTMHQIKEPTLSLREVFELHPWTEMADSLEHFKYPYDAPSKSEKYMEDHVVMAPLGNRLLLKTEQRYSYNNIKKGKHSESLLGYYMRDDNWKTGGWDDMRKDSMIWCCGWDASCEWYTFNPKDSTYSPCTHPITEGDDFLNVPAKMNITPGQAADTVYYCLRARSINTTTAGTTGDPDPEKPVEGNYFFNICRYKVIYHAPAKYGPKLETAGKALITNDEIEQSFEVLERLNFDYNKPGSEYRIYPHPLPWSDASYGYCYQETLELPDNRNHHNRFPSFPVMGEYSLINRIPYVTYWHQMEQHGGAENGYMIYCDGMASPGQVAALSLETQLCEGQKMYFSGYVGNPSNQSGKSNPNFLFSVQGSLNGTTWEDITSYMTGDLQPSNKWYQIFFPIEQKKRYNYFRVRVYNMSSHFDGNDFTIDDMCIFATKPPLVAYQANTTCRTEAENDSITHVVLRVDYQGFDDKNSYNNKPVYYTIEQISEDKKDTTFVRLEDGYYNESTSNEAKLASIYGWIPMPAHDYEPADEDSVYSNLSDLIHRFEVSFEAHGSTPVVREGYIYENLDGVIRPVMYVVHTAKMTADNTYKVHMAGTHAELMSSKCGMTSNLAIKNRMVLEINGEEQKQPENDNLCANTSYDLSLGIKGTLLLDSVAPMDINGSCTNDWLLYGDTARVSSKARYGYYYSDIEKVIKDILRREPSGGISTNRNQFARSLNAINRNELVRIQKAFGVELSEGVEPYKLLSDLVKKGFLTLYRSNLTVGIRKDSTVRYVVFPIVGTGSDAMLKMNVEVCPTPILITLRSPKGGGLPIIVGGFGLTEKTQSEPAVILTDAQSAGTRIVVPIDSINNELAMDQIVFLSTNDPGYRPGIHKLALQPDKEWITDHPSYYCNSDTIFLEPAPTNNYRMQPGYSYTFEFIMKTRLGRNTWDDACPIGIVPFTIAVVPDHVRWDPQGSEDQRWNNPDNWIGIDRQNNVLHTEARFAPLPTTKVIIPAPEPGLPYPELVNESSIESEDSIYQTHFRYNVCDSIRFLPGAVLGNQQRLSYKGAVVDLSIPHGEWSFRTAPVTGLVSGDIFMADADLHGVSSPWEVGFFDAAGRTHTTGNASFWLSLYNQNTYHQGSSDKDTTYTASDEWSKVTNGMDLPLAPAQGWAVFARTRSGKAAEVRLPKTDDIYYYYYKNGEKAWDMYVNNISTTRGGAAGQLTFDPGAGATLQSYTLTNGSSGNTFVFGNPTMAYIDIWGFLSDNGLKNEFHYMGTGNAYTQVTESIAEATRDTITTLERYLPPMHAIVVSLAGDATASSLDVKLYTDRIVTTADQIVRPPVSPSPAPAKSRAGENVLPKGIMTVTATNPVSPRCRSRLLIGQGYHNAVLTGEDALLTTLNIDHYTNNTMPATPFNLYASEQEYGLSIDLLHEVVNVPLSFYLSDLPYDPVTHLWFTGVHNIEGELVLYDALTGEERTILDGICLDIATPEQNHERRYYIRRRGFNPDRPDETDHVATGLGGFGAGQEEPVKIIRNGHVFILRDGHVYTLFGQKIR